MTSDFYQKAENYAAFFAHLTRDSLDSLEIIFSPEARFKNPFNDVIGREKIRMIFAHMFETCEEPRFTINHWAIDGQIAYYWWEYHAKVIFLWRERPVFIQGTSRVTFDTNGLVHSHVDYWDSAEYVYCKLPLIGSILRAIANRITNSINSR
jgi:hypothetical protein